jgi:hypothetical protein
MIRRTMSAIVVTALGCLIGCADDYLFPAETVEGMKIQDYESLLDRSGGQSVLSRNPHEGELLNFYRIQGRVMKVQFQRPAFYTSPIPPWYCSDYRILNARYLTEEEWNEERSLTKDDAAWWRFDPPTTLSSDVVLPEIDLPDPPPVLPVGWTSQGHYIVRDTMTGECFLADENLTIITDYDLLPKN